MTNETTGGMKASAVDYDPFAGEAIVRVVPTTEPQREIWLADRLCREASLAYNESVTLRLDGALDPAALSRALTQLVARHDALRATMSEDGLSLLVATEGAWPLDRVDLSAYEPTAREEALERLRIEAVETPFDLVCGPLARATLARLGDYEHELIITAHHIVCDGWSFGVIAPELMALYGAHLGEPVPPLAPAESFATHAESVAAPDARALAEQDTHWWVKTFEDGTSSLDLPADRTRPALRTFASRREDLALDATLTEAVRRAGARSGASLFVTLFTVYGALLALLARREDLVIGVPAAGQATAGKPGLVGHCVQLLPIRIDARHDRPLSELLESARGRVLDAYEHQACTFGALLAKLNLARDPSRLPLVNVLFNLDAAIREEALSKGGLRVRLATNPRRFENFELFLNASQVDGGLVLECQYNADLFDATTIRRWLALYRSALERLATNPGASVARAFEPTATDLELLARFNATDAPYDRAARIESLIERQARATPEAIAVTCAGRNLTYRELDERANGIAHALRERGVVAGDLVGHCTSRSEHLFTALLGILKAGAGYVPLDPSFPEERLAFMREDARMHSVVSDREAATPGSLVAEDITPAREAPPPAGTSHDVAYVIYTSGSTGRPKGVLVPHRTVANLLASVAREPGMAASDVVLAVTTLSFDIAVSEVILPLTVGARVVLADRAQAMDGDRLRAIVEAEGVNFIDATPSTWRLLLASGWRGNRSLKAICTGEPLPPSLGRELLPLVGELWNGYGPTETTVWSSFHHVLAIDGSVPIGHPVANTQIHVVDAAREQVPVGVVGELFIAGDGVSLGYLDRPDLTAERFLPNPFAARPGATWYRTGDLGRWRTDGTLECLGRIDHQIKVRGYRIEPGEIEAALATVDGVAQCMVMAREDRPGDVRLVGYLVPRAGATLEEGALKAHLGRTLPDYMVPQHFVNLGAIPLLPNGKVDRKTLPAPQAIPTGREFVAPRDELETAVAVEMEAALGLPGLGIHDDFFRLGGHSLLAAQLTARLNRAFKTQLTMRTLFAAPTIALLAEAVREETAASHLPRRKPLVRLATPGEAPMSVMQERLWFLEELNPGRVTYNAPSAHRLTGPLNETAFARAFAEMVRRQPVLRTSFEPRGASAVQRIHAAIDFTLFPAEDLSSLPAGEREARLAKRLDELTAQTFDLKRAPLFKARLFRMSREEHVLFFMSHHIVWDGWSFDVLYDELSSLYEAFVHGRPSPLPELRFTYGDFAAWHRDWCDGPEFAGQLAFWRARLDRIEAAHALPTDRPRRPGMSGAGDTEWMVVGRPLADSLHAIGRQAGATLFLTTLTAYCALLHGYAGQDRLVVGTPVRGRNAVELEPIMGYFNNLVPLAITVDPSQSFLALLERVKAVVVESFSSPDVPLEQLASELAVRRGAGGGSLLYQALYSFQDARQRITRWGDLAHAVVPLFQKGATEDLGLWFVESSRGLHGGVTYNTDIFDRATAQELHRAFLALLAGIAADPAKSVAELLGPKGAAVRAKAPANSLPMPSASVRTALTPTGTPPSSETEKRLAEIWREQLKLPQVSLEDNFFDLGGHSLLAIQVIVAMETRSGKRVDRNRYIFETLGQIARAYDESAPVEEPSPAKPGGLRGLFSSLVGGRKP